MRGRFVRPQFTDRPQGFIEGSVCLPIHYHSEGDKIVQATATQLLSRREASTYLAISQRKLDQLTASGDLPRIRIGSCVRFEQADLDAFITARKSA